MRPNGEHPQVVILGGGFGGLAAAQALGGAAMRVLLAWLFVHLVFLVGFRNRVAVVSQWLWAYVTNKRASRVVFSHPKEQGPTVLEPRPSHLPSAAEQATAVPAARPSGTWAWSRSDD
jgi:hypothetical protein